MVQGTLKQHFKKAIHGRTKKGELVLVEPLSFELLN